ncbi:MAG: CopG family transcriptional regulator [Micrococcales bacterium]|nr:CopG family transcriptional regulator [Micrococcales bacterium]
MTSPDAPPEIGHGPTRPVTVTLTEGTLVAVRQAAGPRGTSSLVEQALQRELRRLALQRLVDGYEQEHGPISDREVATQMARLARVRQEAADGAA